MSDLAALIKAATPEPPIDLSVADVRPHHRRPLAPLAAAAVVLALAAGGVVVARHQTQSPAASKKSVVVTFLNHLHLVRPGGWTRLTNLLSAGPGYSEFLTNVPVPASCVREFAPSCVPMQRLRGDQVLITVETVRKSGYVGLPNRVVAGMPAHVEQRPTAQCPYRQVTTFDAPPRILPTSVTVSPVVSRSGIISVDICSSGAARKTAEQIMATAYFDRPPRTDLGLVRGRLVEVGGPPPAPTRGIPRPKPLSGTIKVGPFTTPAGSDGVWAVAVPPGSYSVTAVSPQVVTGKTPEPCQGAHKISLRPQATVTVDVACHVD